MVNHGLREEAKQWIVDRLQETNQFEIIDPNYLFNDHILNVQRNRNIFTRKRERSRDEFSRDYLIVVSVDPLTSDLIKEKAQAASRNGIAIAFVQHKKSPGKSKVKEFEFYNWAGTITEKDRAESRHLGRAGYSHQERRRHIETVFHERTLNDLTKRRVLYFNPDPKRLEVIKFIPGVQADYSYLEERIDMGEFEVDRIPDREYVTIMDHTFVGAYPTFTLRSSIRNNVLHASPIAVDGLSRLVSLCALEQALGVIGLEEHNKPDRIERFCIALDRCDPKTLRQLPKALKRYGLESPVELDQYPLQ